MKRVMIAAGLGAIAGFAIATFDETRIDAVAQSGDGFQSLTLFGDIFERVRAQYVEEVEEKDLVETAINGMLASLDPHSSYLPPQSFEEMQEQTKGEFGGLGIEVTMENGLVKVVAPIDDTPAAAAGLQANDLVSELDGEAVLGLTLSEAVEKMRGPVGSDITLTILREGVEEPFQVTITRAIITIYPVRARAEGDIAYLRVTTFNEQTSSNLEKKIADLKAEIGGDGPRGYVIDLRNNPGGLLNQAIAVTDTFLEKGEIVSTRGRDPRDAERYNATPGDLSEGKPVVVLINGGSASASEIVAGALQDHRRAVIIGTTSFGKGSVQTIMPLSNRGAIRLTTQRYYTPSGRSIQALGVEPDILIERILPEETAEAAAEGEDDAAARRRTEDSLRNSLGRELTDEEKRQRDEKHAENEAQQQLRDEDNQLAYALDLLRGVTAFDALRQQ
ncbi:MAG: S41 family peptidase [Pseudomonadota bacterium]